MAKTATKAKKAAPADEAQGKALIAHEIIRSPSIQNAIGMHAWGKFAGEADLSELVRDLQVRTEKVQGGDLRQLEAMLFGQAMVLQTAFTNLSRRASSAEYLKQFSVYMGLALKAQAQARSTLEALAEIRNPRPVMFAKQANVTSGNQQINNGTMPDGREIRAGSHAEENPSLQNELLEQRRRTIEPAIDGRGQRRVANTPSSAGPALKPDFSSRLATSRGRSRPLVSLLGVPV